VKKQWFLVEYHLRKSCPRRSADNWSGVTLGNHVSEETMTADRMLPSAIMSEKKHGLLFGCYPRKSCQLRNSDDWPDVTLLNHFSDETLTTGQTLHSPSGIMSVTKHWLLVGWYPRESCQLRNTDYLSDATRGNHVREETLTTGWMLFARIMSLTKHCYLSDITIENHASSETLLLVGCYLRESCQWRNTNYLSDATLWNHNSENTLITSRVIPSEIKSPLARCIDPCSDDNTNVDILLNVISMMHIHNIHLLWQFPSFCFVLFCFSIFWHFPYYPVFICGGLFQLNSIYITGILLTEFETRLDPFSK
jgi:hypothetical protein